MFRSFFRIFASFCIGQINHDSSIRVKEHTNIFVFLTTASMHWLHIDIYRVMGQVDVDYEEYMCK